MLCQLCDNAQKRPKPKNSKSLKISLSFQYPAQTSILSHRQLNTNLMSVHRIKERGSGSGSGGGAKITAGKENPTNPLYCHMAQVQKPSIHQVPRITRSNSVVPPKGSRSSSPFEFNRVVLNDVRKDYKGSFGSKDSGVRSVSNGRRSVCVDQQNIGSFKVGNVDLGLKENNGVMRDFSDMRKDKSFGEKERSVSSGRGSVSGDRGLGTSQRKVGSFRDLNVKSGERVVKNGQLSGKSEGGLVFHMGQQNIGSFRDLDVKSGGRIGNVDVGLKEKNGEMRGLEKGGRAERSVSNGRRSVSGDQVFGMSQAKVGSFKVLDVKPGQRVVKSGEFGRKSEGGFGINQQKNGGSRDLNAKTGVWVENINGVVKEKEGYEKSGEISEKSQSGLKGSGDLGSRVLDRSQQKIGSLIDSNVNLGENLGVRRSQELPVRSLKERKSMGFGERSKVSVMDEGKSEDGLSSNLSKSRSGSSDSDIKKRNSRNLASSEREKSVHYTKETSGKVSNAMRGSERLKQKGLVEENASVRGINKYPSKLHEKLAFLEGKVKRIASDIKKTKEMLDLNNPDSSKVVLSDIQEKISGIEKAMGNVADRDKQTNVLEKVENKKVRENDDNVSEDVERKEVENMKSSVKGLNSEELEARLFPHHKLLRDRTSSKVSSASSDKVDIETKVEEKVSSQDESPVEVEFLASLVKEQIKVTVRGESDGAEVSKSQENMYIVEKEDNIILTTDETLDDFGEKQIKTEIFIDEDVEDNFVNQFSEIGHKTSTCGWFVADGEAALLAHDDGSCTYYDIANSEVKSEYKPPVGISQNMWRDCWIVRAPGPDGSSGRYVVAASAGNTLESGFCSWDFYNKDIRAFHIEDGTTNNTRTALAPLPNNPSYRRNSFSNIIASENRHWWYKPCGPLIVSTASNQKAVCIYDIRDGEHIMRWEVQKPVLLMDYSSPLQWRNRGKVVIAESECVSLWDVSSLTPQALQSISTSGRRVCALHVNNTDAELGGGVRQRVSSSEAEGHDGVFCTTDSINVVDFRHPSGIGLKISKIGVNVQSLFSQGDSIFLGCNNAKSAVKNLPCPQIQHFSLRKQKLVSTYSFPESNAHPHYTAITQVWGNSNLVMGVCGLGLFVFDALKDDGVRFPTVSCSMQKVRETIGPNDLYSPSFDYLSSRVLLISRDRPALWRYLS